jgi:hypothetical protein
MPETLNKPRARPVKASPVREKYLDTGSVKSRFTP